MPFWILTKYALWKGTCGTWRIPFKCLMQTVCVEKQQALIRQYPTMRSESLRGQIKKKKTYNLGDDGGVTDKNRDKYNFHI